MASSISTMRKIGQTVAVMLSFCFMICAMTPTTATPVSKRAPVAKHRVRISESLPNPIYEQYPDFPTGTLNMTVTVIPIPLAVARSMVPIKYPILTDAYLELLPETWDPSLYPMVVETRYDHDLRYQTLPVIPDFQSLVILFPFVGRLGADGGSFTYTDKNLISSGATAAIEGAESYGEEVMGAKFDPKLQGYAWSLDLWGRKTMGDRHGERYVKVFEKGAAGMLVAEIRFIDDHEVWEEEGVGCDEGCLGGEYGIQFYKNITNQPLFSKNSSICDNQILFYNTSISTGSNAPVSILSDVYVSNSWFSGGIGAGGWGFQGEEDGRYWEGRPVDGYGEDGYGEDGEKVQGMRRQGARGIRVDAAFVEKNYVECEKLRGYAG